MPLAIEMAAAWVRVMACGDIARELGESMDLLATTMRDVSPRHRSMRAVLDHSWGLLTNAERGVLGALAVFRGGFLREGAGAVAGASLATLSALIDKSWIRRSPSGRYEMHELIMQYCFEKLDAQPDEDGTTSTVRARDRHSQYYGAFLRAREPHLHGLGQAEAFAEILQEMHNVRAGWRWAVECGDVETLSSYLETLWYAGVVRAWHHEVLQLLEEAAAVLGRQPDPIARDREGAVPERATLVLSEILSQQAAICEHLGLRERGIMLCEESLALLPKVERGARRDRVAVSTKVMLGELWRTSGHTSQARQCLREALALADETGDEWGKENSLFFLGTAMRNLGRYSEAEGLLQQAIAIADETGEQWGKAACLDSLSWVLCAKGDYHAADRLAQESLRIRQCLGDQAWLGYSFVRLGETAAALGNAELATQHYHQGLAVANEVVHPALRGECLRGQATLASLLGQHEEAQQLFEDTRRTAIEAGEVGLWTDALVGLGHAACALGEAQQARAWLCEALEKATRAERAHATTSAVTGLASLASREGDTERAVELLALVLDHPATTQVTKDRASQLLAELAPELSAELFAEAMERGQARELGEVAAELLGGGADAADGD
jgi:tetratricopeptide (TPR) repeat protein